MTIRNVLLTISAILFLCNCSHTTTDKKETPVGQDSTSIENSPIESISVLYFNYLFLEKFLISCDDIKLSVPDFETRHKGVLDATITDPKVLDEIKEHLTNLEPSNDDYLIDARITATVTYKNGKQDQLCIGQMDANTIFLNGIQQKTDNRLLYLIKNNIGYYPWMIGDGLQEMSELKDNTFIKEPFVSDTYYKTWQEIKTDKK